MNDVCDTVTVVCARGRGLDVKRSINGWLEVYEGHDGAHRGGGGIPALIV